MASVVPYGNSCTPFALGILLKEDYDSAYMRLYDVGSNPRSVATSELHKVLNLATRIKKVVWYLRNRKPFKEWRKTRTSGTWFVLVTSCYIWSSHCIVLRNGLAYDNGWYQEQGCLFPLKVLCAWKIEERH